MAEFALPKNSKIKSRGRDHRVAGEAKRVKKFRI